MAKAEPKITLSSSRDIPFNKLVLSQANVRRVKADISIEELAEDIARRSLLQGLTVRPQLDDNGNETGMYEVPAGGRRYRALQLLVKQKRLAKTAAVPCVIRDTDATTLAEEDSLAENVQRAPLHPLDQFRAFQTLREKGLGEEEIAATFFIGVNVVRQRLRLAGVSEKLLEIYADDGMSLEQLMAFTVSIDHARQEEVWATVADSYNDAPHQIRRMLTERTVRASDKRARFVGLEACQTAGGVVLRDLFEADDGGWLQDAALLDRLVAGKLKAAAESVAAEGWKWIEVAVDFPYGHTRALRELDGVETEMTAKEKKALQALNTEQAKLEAEYQDAEEVPDDVDRRLGEIQEAIEALEERPLTYDADEVKRAGAFVSIGADGRLRVERGFVRLEDEAPEPVENCDEIEFNAGNDVDPGAAAVQPTVITLGGKPAQVDDEEEEDGIKPLPERLVTELTVYRTLALRDAVAGNPHIAMTVLLYKLVRDTFRVRTSTSCLDASVREVYFPAQPDGLNDSAAAKAVEDRHAGWKRDLPDDDDALWDWLNALDEASRMALLAHCVSYGINALYERGDRYGSGALSPHGVRQRIAEADRLAHALGLDMAEAGWRPTVANYFGRVSKARILEAVREAKGEPAAQLIDHLKKPDMAKEAERLLADSDWLPEPLRGLDLDAGADGEPTDDTGKLPAFLNEDADEADEPDLQTTVLAAE
ncbi:MAG: ParB/RepB/Spo0J family partition protein [Hyphomicrobiaceae bacterium]|nr:ParB/RepB/Spo0J family partition protein [Hyphomicrobiaceae bacterium]